MNACFFPVRVQRLAALLVFAAGLAGAGAQNAVRYESQPSSWLRIDGTSTVHDWSVNTALIGGAFEVDEAFLKDPASKDIKVKPKVDVFIGVRSLKSGKKPMDNIMYDAMKATEHPKINYVMKEMTLKEPPAKPGAPSTFNTKGELTVSGVKKPIEMVVKMERPERDRLKFSGTAAVKMTDFGITPPAPALAAGLIKTGDDVKIVFEWNTLTKPPAPAQ